MSNPKEMLNSAYDLEGFNDLLDDMDELLTEAEAEGGRKVLSDMDIRRMVLRRKYLERDAEKLKAMRDSVKAEWDRKIDVQKKNIERLDTVIREYVKEGGETLSLDVATIFPRRVNHKLEISSLESLITTLKQNNSYESFVVTPEPSFSESSVKTYYIQQLNEQIERINEEAKAKIAALDVEYKESTKEIKKPADKKPIMEKLGQRKKEILEEAKSAVASTITAFQAHIPTGMTYVPESQNVTIRMN